VSGSVLLKTMSCDFVSYVFCNRLSPVDWITLNPRTFTQIILSMLENLPSPMVVTLKEA
jgi:hypothetical protein